MGDCNCKHGASGSGGVCVECDIPQLARNNYFTGKLLVERDFTDEQRYLMGKQRRHNQRLHGWGAVCGLKVKPHLTCPDRYVMIEPGTAIDCCGREILIKAEEYFGFKEKFLENFQKQNGPNAQPDPNTTYKIQICVSYKECGTEDIPALFDDCNCDATSCQPNRILESNGFDVLIDPKTSGTDGQNIDVNWSCTIGLANVVGVAVNDATKRLFILTSDSTANTATLYVVDATNDSILASQTFAKNLGRDVVVSPAGDFVYVALQPTAPASAAPQILVMATSDLTTTINTLTPVGLNGDPIRLAVAPAPDSRLLAVILSAGKVFVWNTDINKNPPVPAPATQVTVGSNPVSIAVSDSGLYAYVANSGDSSVSAITLAGLAVTPLPAAAGLAGSTPGAIAVASTTAGDTLAVLDKTSKTLYLISIPSGGPGSASAIGDVTTFAYSPIDVSLSPAGHWAYVLEKDSSATAQTGYIQVVDVDAVQLSGPNILGAPVSVGLQPLGETLSDDGSHLYVWYNGDGKSIPGGVAILNVVQDGCCDLFKQTIEGCPDCTDGNCIVLATINSYRYDNPIGGKDIDNLTDRHLLVSTDILTQAVQCLCEQRGVSGKPGKDGATGPAGPGLESGLTHIIAISWVHAQKTPQAFVQITNTDGALVPALVVAFDAPVKVPAATMDSHVFEMRVVPQDDVVPPLNLPVEFLVNGTVVPVSFPVNPLPGQLITTATGATAISGPTNASGLAFIPSTAGIRVLPRFKGGDVHVFFRGDFVQDVNGAAVSCQFVRAALPTGEIPPLNVGLEGGLFYSWFTTTGTVSKKT
jgi:DNA-binding beta-propeller fold protein YncE